MPGERDAHMHPDLERILFTADEIARRTSELGRQVALDYRDKAPLVVSTLKGSVLFFSDIVRCMTPVPDGMRLEFVRAKSYHGDATESSGRVEVSLSTMTAGDVAGRHVLLVRWYLSHVCGHIVVSSIRRLVDSSCGRKRMAALCLDHASVHRVPLLLPLPTAFVGRLRPPDRLTTVPDTTDVIRSFTDNVHYWLGYTLCRLRTLWTRGGRRRAWWSILPGLARRASRFARC